MPIACRVGQPGRCRHRARQPNRPSPVATQAIANRCASSRQRITDMMVAVAKM
jgi:hypothetical protein